MIVEEDQIVIRRAGDGRAGPRLILVRRRREARPDDGERRADDLLARHMRVLAPPHRQPGQAGADDLGRHLHRLLIARPGQTLGRRLAREDDAEGDPRLAPGSRGGSPPPRIA